MKINPNKNTKIIHDKSVIWGKFNSGIGKSKFNSLRIILYSVSISSIILGKNMKKLQNKMINTVFWSTQGCDFNTNHTSKV